MIEYEIPFVCLIFTSLISIVFFLKEKVKLQENHYYMNILVFTLFVNITNFVSHYMASIYAVVEIPDWFATVFATINKLGSLFIVIITTNFLCYILHITFDGYRKRLSYFTKLNYLFYLVIGILIFILEFNVYKVGAVTSGKGSSIILAYLIVFFDLIFSFIVALINIKKYDKRYYAIYIIVLLMLILGIFVMLQPQFNIYDLILTLLCYIMYFTIENPDLKMIDELQKNRALTESSMEDKSLFMFKMLQDIKQPLKNVSNLIKEFDEGKLSKEEVTENYKKVEANIENLNFIVNNIINVSDMDLSKVRIVDTSYDVKNFFESIKKQVEVKIKENKDVKLRYEITDAIPEELYGDYIKLKQVITTIINNSIKYTEKGIIQLDIDAITRYDLCRLIIKVRDTGCGMPLDQINDILRNNYEFEESEYKKLDKLHLTLEMSIKLIRMLGGNVNIKSDIDHGTEITLIIDQKVKEQEKTEISNDIDKYSTSIFGNRRVLIVDDDSDEINKIVKILTKDNVQTNISMFGKDCIDKIKVGEKYKLILMDDEMKPDNALPTLKKLKEIKKFNIPVIVMLNKEKEFIKEHYIKDGFTDYLLKDDLEKELKRIIEKHL